jgi:hypothetical protein
MPKTKHKHAPTQNTASKNINTQENQEEKN